MLDQIHDSHYYCRESRISKHSPASNAPSKAIVVAQKELQKIKSSLPDVSRSLNELVGDGLDRANYVMS